MGGFRVSIASETNGSLALAEVLPGGGTEMGGRIDQGIQRVGDAQQQVNTWWSNLSPLEQQNPVNKAKFEAANQALARAGEFLSAADAAVNRVATSTVQYAMDKTVKDAWNFIVGGQFQLNKHVQFRCEVGLLGSRTQVITGIQYRFGL